MNKVMFLKMVVVSVLTGAILIALAAVSGVLASRESYRDDAIKSIAESYSGQQKIVGPILVMPYTETVEDVSLGDKGGPKVTQHKREGNLIVFPETLTVHGVLQPSERRHGLYKVTVYELESHIEGSIDVPAPEARKKAVYGTPYLAIGLADVRGIVGSPAMRINGAQVEIEGTTRQETLSWKPNLRATLPAQIASGKSTLQFALDLTLAGTEQLSIAPVATSNHFELSSSWRSPLFAGRFLPRTRELTKDGFHAVWEISSLAAATQSQITDTSAANTVDTIDVSLLNPIDPYKLSDRAVKYGVLFVLLTFGGFFLFEIVKRMPIHPIQYLLVGFGLALFFLLLISLSEHLPFASAYVIASVACIGLLTYYLCFVLHSVRYGASFGLMLTLLYAAIYGLLISEDNALMLGSMLLFLLLGGIMISTRKVDWYKGNTEPVSSPAASKDLSS